MIVIRSFSLNNLTRRVWEFYGDKLVIKTKSLSADYEAEWDYKKIKEIRHKKLADLSWVWTAAMVLGLFFLAQWFLSYLSINFLDNPRIEKVIVILAVILLIPAFRKHELYSFLDADSCYLTTIRVNDKNKKLLWDAIELLKQETQVIRETYLNASLPNSSPVFELQVFDFPDYLSKSIVRVYEDKLIDWKKSLVEEVRTEVRFNDLSGEITRARVGNKNWDNFASIWFVSIIFTSAIVVVFFPDRLYHNFLFFRLFLGAMFLVVPLYLLKYIKGEILMFYDKKDNDVFWTRVNRTNRKTLDQIVRYVQAKVQSNP